MYAPRNRTKVSGSERTPRAKMWVPGAGRAVNRNLTDFVRVGMESVQITYDFLGLCHLWAASTFLWLAFDAYVPVEVDGYLCRAHRQPSPVIHIKPLRILLQGMDMLRFQLENSISNLSNCYNPFLLMTVPSHLPSVSSVWTPPPSFLDNYHDILYFAIAFICKPRCLSVTALL